MFSLIRWFQKDNCGAVTVDIVVLTAAIIGLAIAILIAVETSTTGLAEHTAAELASGLTK